VCVCVYVCVCVFACVFAFELLRYFVKHTSTTRNITISLEYLKSPKHTHTYTHTYSKKQKSNMSSTTTEQSSVSESCTAAASQPTIRRSEQRARALHNSTRFHEIACLICPSCRFIEFPGCMAHSAILTYKKGNSHMACAGCVVDEAARKGGARVSILHQVAETDTSIPWCESCRNCHQKRAYCFPYIVTDSQAERIGVAMTLEKEDTIPHVAVACSDCHVLVFPTVDGRLTRDVQGLIVERNTAETLNATAGGDAALLAALGQFNLDPTQFLIDHYAPMCEGKPRLVQVMLSKSEAKYCQDALPSTPALPENRLLIPGYIAPRKWTVLNAQTEEELKESQRKLYVLGAIDQLNPVWRDRAFSGVFGDAFVRNTELEGGFVAPSIKTLLFTLEKLLEQHSDWLTTEPNLDALQRVVEIMRVSSELANEAHEARDIDMKSSDEQKSKAMFCFLLYFRTRIDNMADGDVLMVPSGWISTSFGHAIMCIIFKHSDDNYSFSISNTGGGLMYHPSATHRYPKETFRTSLIIDNIPASRMCNDGFWMLFWNLQFIQSERHDEKMLYEVLFPYLAGGKSMAEIAVDCESNAASNEWRTPQRAGSCYFKSVLEAFRFLLRSVGLSKVQAKQIAFATRYQMLSMAHTDLSRMESLQDESDRVLVRLAARQTAHAALKEHNAGRLTEQSLQDLQRMISEIEARIAELPLDIPPTNDCPPQLSLISAQEQKHTSMPAMSTQFQNFELFLGDTQQQAEKIATLHGIPVLADLPQHVDVMSMSTDFPAVYDSEAEPSALIRLVGPIDRALLLCSQLDTIDSVSACFQQLLVIQNLVTRILPIPVPGSIHNSVQEIIDESPEMKDALSVCVWRAATETYTAQCDLVQKLYSLMQHYMVATFSIDTPHTNGPRAVVMAALMSMLDAVIRVRQTDQPSLVARVLAGVRRQVAEISADGKQEHYDAADIVDPEKSYGLCTKDGRGRSLAALTAHLPLVDAALALTRANVLEYFEDQAAECSVQIFDYPCTTGMFSINLNSQNPSLQIVRDMANLGGYTIKRSDYSSRETTEVESVARWLYSSDDYSVVDHESQVTPLARSHKEWAPYRDAAFLFHLALMPNAFNTVPLSRWHLKDCKLRWVYRAIPFQKDNVLGDCRAFSRKEPLYLKNIPGAKYKSPADPTRYVNKKVVREGDILAAKSLPTFNDTLTEEMAQSLFAFLTVPYLRTPLVVSFFASRDRVELLTNTELRDLFEAVLFEPGPWTSALNPRSVTNVPVPSKDSEHILGCFAGTLFTELSECSDAFTSAFLSMVQHAIELDPGVFDEDHRSIAEMILFIIRIAVRVEQTAQLVLEVSASGDNSVFSMSSDQCPFRCESGAVVRLKAFLRTLGNHLRGPMLSSLLQWRMKQYGGEQDIQRACQLNSHIALLFQNAPADEMQNDQDKLIAAAGSLLHVLTWYGTGIGTSAGDGFDIQQDTDSKESKDGADNDEPSNNINEMMTKMMQEFQADKSVQKLKPKRQPTIPELQVCFAAHCMRTGLVRWLEAVSIAERDALLDGVVRWVHGRDVAHICADDSKQGAMWSIDTESKCPGVYAHVDNNIKISLQTWEVLLSQNEIRPVVPEIARNSEFRWLFGGELQHAALDRMHEFCAHYTVVGSGWNLAVWEPSERFEQLVGQPEALGAQDCKSTADREVSPTWMCTSCHEEFPTNDEVRPRCPGCHALKPQLSAMEQYGVRWCDSEQHSRRYGAEPLDDSERWIAEILEPVLDEMYGKDKDRLNYSLWLPACKYASDAQQARVIGLDMHADNTWKEFLMYRGSQVLHVFNLVERGRQYFRQQVYSSDARHSFAQLKRTTNREKAWSKFNRHSAGSILDSAERELHFVVQRTHTSGEVRQYLPPDALTGLLPAILLEQYVFWWVQSAHGDRVQLEAYKRATSLGSSHIDAQPALTVAIHSDTGAATVTKLDSTNGELILLNALHPNADPSLHSIANVLVRLEDMSHTLYWARSDAASLGCARSIFKIELPRLGIEFVPRHDTDGLLQLYCTTFSGWYISQRRTEAVSRLLRGLPSSILLENSQKELAVLASNCPVIQPRVPTCPFSTELVPMRDDSEWQSTLKSYCYLYRVHISGEFLLPDTLASNLFLILQRLLARQYEQAAVLLETAEFDELSDEEAYWFAQFERTLDDKHPDASACRLKLLLAGIYSSQLRSIPWKAADPDVAELTAQRWQFKEEYSEYLKKLQHISRRCRLTLAEELKLLSRMSKLLGKEFANKQTDVQNRLRFVQQAVPLQQRAAGTGVDSKIDLSHTIRPRTRENNYTPWDKWCGQVRSFFKRFWIPSQNMWFATVSYERPEKAHGYELLLSVQSMLKDDMSGTACRLGFMFVYELLTGQLPTYLFDPSDADTFIESMRIKPGEEKKVPSDHRPAARTPDCSSELGFLLAQVVFAQETGYGERINPTAKYMPFAMSAVLGLYRGDQSIASRMPLTEYKEHEEDYCAGLHVHKTTNILGKVVHAGSGVIQSIVCTDPLWQSYAQARGNVTGGAYKTPTGFVGVPLLLEDVVSDCARSCLTLDCSNIADKLPELQQLLVPQTDGGAQNCSINTPVDIASIVDTLSRDFVVDDITQFAGAPLADSSAAHTANGRIESTGSESKGGSLVTSTLRQHPVSTSALGQKLLDRLEADIKMREATLASHVGTMLANFSAAVLQNDASQAPDALEQLRLLKQQLVASITSSRALESTLSNFAVYLASAIVPDQKSANCLVQCLRFALERYDEQHARLDLPLLVRLLLSSRAKEDLRMLNPFLSDSHIELVTQLTTAAVFCTNRIGCLHRALASCSSLIDSVNTLVADGVSQSLSADSARNIELLSSSLAKLLSVKRHFVTRDDNDILEFDPRFLVFEYVFNIVLRKQQVRLVHTFVDAALRNESMVHQMIMGAGKTTVVAPLLCLILANGKRLVTQVVPSALLRMSRQVLRAQFSVVVPKRIQTLHFDRSVNCDLDELQCLADKVLSASEDRGVIIATDVSIKSLMLKFIEYLHVLEGADSTDLSDPRQQAEFSSISSAADKLACVLGEFRRGILILDEVDLLLHPLRSELNFPIGAKVPLDPSPERWQLPMHLLDAVHFDSSHPYISARDVANHPQSDSLLAAVQQVVQDGLKCNAFQRQPHLVLLDKSYYKQHLIEPLAHWSLLWLRSHGLATPLDDETLVSYLVSGWDDDSLAKQVRDCVSPQGTQLLNLTHDWLHSFAPHILSKINRVAFGLLPPWAIRSGEPVTRKLGGIPYVAKDVPSTSSEFAHPDVLIGLSILAYRIEGLRLSDLKHIVATLKQQVQQELGPESSRPSELLYQNWLAAAARRAESTKNGSDFDRSALTLRRAVSWASRDHSATAAAAAVDDEQDDVSQDADSAADALSLSRSLSNSSLPAPLTRNSSVRSTESDAIIHSATATQADQVSAAAAVNVESATSIVSSLAQLRPSDDIQIAVLHGLLAKEPLVVEHYVFDHVFPRIMNHHLYNLSASGQELGGSMLFETRLGFSGTPSDMLPLELGSCHYENGSDARMIQYLTDPSIIDHSSMPDDWSAASLLHWVASHTDPVFHALIDTGALITGLSNRQVAECLLRFGLSHIDGVVFLDEHDNQMILHRGSTEPVELSQSGVSLDRRFAFYDQIHATGIDIKSTPTAVAAVTIGKDMTFRDYSQGAFRMRGIGNGQRIHAIIVPEVRSLIASRLAVSSASSSSLSNHPVPVDLVVWLFLNSVAQEQLSFGQLCLQNLANVWRKQAFNVLLEDCTNVVATATRHRRYLAKGTQSNSVDLFREDVDFSVEHSVPTPQPLLQRIDDEVNVHKYWIKADSQHADLATVRQQIELLQSGASASDGSTLHTSAAGAFDQEMVNEQERETVQQKQMEVQKKPFYSRTMEKPKSWPLIRLKDEIPSGGDAAAFRAFFMYPMYHFAVKEQAALPFPPGVMISQNFYRQSWSGFRRVKDVHVVVEWIVHSSTDSKESESGIAVASSSSRVAATQLISLLSRGCDEQKLSHAKVNGLMRLSLLHDDGDGDGDGANETPSLDECVSSALSAASSIPVNVTQTRRCFAIVSLAEAETIRKAVHMRHRAFRDASVALWTPHGRIIDASFKYAEQRARLDEIESVISPTFSPTRLALLSARMLNCDFYYSEQEVAAILFALRDASPDDRAEWMKRLLVCRTRERSAWTGTPMDHICSVRDHWQWLLVRALCVAISDKLVLLEQGITLLDVFNGADFHHRGYLAVEELWTLCHHLGLANSNSNSNSDSGSDGDDVGSDGVHPDIVYALSRMHNDHVNFQVFVSLFELPKEQRLLRAHLPRLELQLPLASFPLPVTDDENKDMPSSYTAPSNLTAEQQSIIAELTTLFGDSIPPHEIAKTAETGGYDLMQCVLLLSARMG
jgi:Protein of unknown function (DUF3638)/Protein of unknown function (DUF3645)